MLDQRASSAYARVQKAGGSPRETESRALIEANRRLTAAQRTPEDRKALEQAVLFNLRLWNVFASDVQSPGNPLPPELKSNLLTLFRFVDRQTQVVLKTRAAERVASLVSINREIMAGLSARQNSAPAA